jgi:aryl-alcohol dehydrogenase-like predicted oxidoreductase
VSRSALKHCNELSSAATCFHGEKFGRKQLDSHRAQARAFERGVGIPAHAWGGWALFQELLAVLKQIADKHRVSIANAGVRYILERPAVAGVIVGTRLGVAQHLDDNARVFGFATDGEDEAKIETVLAKSRNLSQLIGDCGDEYR